MAKTQFIINSPRLHKALKALVNGEEATSNNISASGQIKSIEQRIIPARRQHQTGEYNGPFKMSFDADGKLFITGGVFEANGIFMIAPTGNIMPTLGYVCLCYNISDAEIYYSIIESLPENNDKNILITPLGHITKNEDGGALQIAQWFWDIPSMSNPVQLPAFTSNDGTVSITHDVENNTVDFSVYTPIMQGSMNNVFEIVKDDESQQYQFRYKDEYETVRIAGDLLLYGDSNGHLQTMAWKDITAKQYLMVYGDDLHYKLVAPGDSGDFIMVNNKNDGIKWLAVDTFSTGVNLVSPEKTINITPQIAEDGTVSTQIDLAPFYLKEYIESADGSVTIKKISERGIDLSVTGMLKEVNSQDKTLFIDFEDGYLTLDTAPLFLYENITSSNDSVTIKSTGTNSIDLSVDGVIVDVSSPDKTIFFDFTDGYLGLDVSSTYLQEYITSTDGSVTIKNNGSRGIDLSVSPTSGYPSFTSSDESISITYKVDSEGVVTSIDLIANEPFIIESTDESVSITATQNSNLKTVRYDLSVPFSATVIQSEDGSIAISPLKNSMGVIYGYDLSSSGLSGIPENGNGILARISGVWQFIPITEECE